MIVDRLDRLGVTREEFLVLKALLLANCDCEVEGQSSVIKLRETLLSSLQDVVLYIRCGDASLHLQNILLVLPCLRTADSVLRTFWNMVRQEGQIPMNKLLMEMLET